VLRVQKKFREKYVKKRGKLRKIIYGIYCYDNIRGAVFRVQGILANREICTYSHKIPKKNT
jgi:hypothetical protein